MAEDLDDLIRTLRASGGDTTRIEVKAAAGGLPVSLTASLSALANLPGGGTIILGLDERAGFRPVPLADPEILKQGLAAKARAYTPPVRLSVGDGLVDGQPVIVAQVHECDPSVIQAAAEPLPQNPPAARARNQITITGAIPRMLDTALDWARRTFDTVIVASPDGLVADQPTYRCE